MDDRRPGQCREALWSQDPAYRPTRPPPSPLGSRPHAPGAPVPTALGVVLGADVAAREHPVGMVETRPATLADLEAIVEVHTLERTAYYAAGDALPEEID